MDIMHHTGKESKSCVFSSPCSTRGERRGGCRIQVLHRGGKNRIPTENDEFPAVFLLRRINSFAGHRQEWSTGRPGGGVGSILHPRNVAWAGSLQRKVCQDFHFKLAKCRGRSGGTRLLNKHASVLNVAVTDVCDSCALGLASLHPVGLRPHSTVGVSDVCSKLVLEQHP